MFPGIARVPIIMPQLGESIAEATVVRLPFAVGDQVEGDADYVYVETAQHTYRKRVVRLGPEKNGLRVVREGLREGERVVTHGALFLAAEQSS